MNNKVYWSKKEDSYIAEHNGNVAEDKELIKAIEKAVRKD